MVVVEYVVILVEAGCHGAEAVATERMYSRSLQDVARSIVRVEGVRRVIYLVTRPPSEVQPHTKSFWVSPSSEGLVHESAFI